LAGDVSLGKELSSSSWLRSDAAHGRRHLGSPEDRKAALAVLPAQVELEVNFIDTADSYGPTSVRVDAEALIPLSNGLVIATKGGWNRPGPNQWTHDATPINLREAVEAAQATETDRIDIYQLHTPDPVVPFEASVETRPSRELKVRFGWLPCRTLPGAYRARAQTCSYRLGPKPLQLCRS